MHFTPSLLQKMCSKEQRPVEPTARFDWTESEIAVLIYVWEEHEDELRTQKKNKPIWDKMTEKLIVRLNSSPRAKSLTSKRLTDKIDTLKKQYRKEREKKGSTGGTPSAWVFFERIHKIVKTHAIYNQDLLLEGEILQLPIHSGSCQQQLCNNVPLSLLTRPVASAAYALQSRYTWENWRR